jgi:hypothetical protein
MHIVRRRSALWSVAVAASLGIGTLAAAQPAMAASAARQPSRVASTDANAERVISRRAAADQAKGLDTPSAQVERAIARFHRNHPTYRAPAPGADGVVSAAEVIKAAEESQVAADAVVAGTSCTPTWATIQWGINGQNMVPRYYGAMNAWPIWTNGNPKTEPWNTWVLLCRDPLWEPGDYAIYFNLTAKYLYVGFAGVLYGDSAGPLNAGNLLRIRQYDGNWQTLWSPSHYRWVTGRSAAWIAADAVGLNGNTLFKVRPMPAHLPCDPYGLYPRCVT